VTTHAGSIPLNSENKENGGISPLRMIIIIIITDQQNTCVNKTTLMRNFGFTRCSESMYTLSHYIQKTVESAQ